MTTWRLQHAFQSRSGSSKDMYVNTFHFVGNPTDEITELGALAAAVKEFYVAPRTSSSTGIVTYMSDAALGPGSSIKIYDLADPVGGPEHLSRPPHYTELAFGEISSNAFEQLPEEVAVCLSMEGLHVAGANIKRRRGRIYLGPFSVQALGPKSVSFYTTVKPQLANAIVEAATQLMGDALALGFTWVVHSETGHFDTTLGRVWVDNTFDTVRGRGVRSGARIVQEGAPFQVGV